MDYLKHALAIVIAAILALTIYGAYQSPQPQQQAATGSTAGATFGTYRVASQVVSVSTSTVFSMLNTDTSDRVVLGADMFLTGDTTATSTQYAVTCATSTVAYGVGPSTSNILAMTVSPSANSPYGTTTAPGSFYMSTTSPGVTGTTTASGPAGGAVSNFAFNNFARIWPANTYLVCTLVTTVGSNSNLFDSQITGTISFPYRSQ